MRNASLSTVLIVIALLLVGGCAACATQYYKETPTTLHVTGKESVNTDDGHEYRIYANEEVYVMSDSLIKGRFRTANDYAAIQPGHAYKCQAFGWRVPLFSMFKNLYECKEVPA